MRSVSTRTETHQRLPRLKTQPVNLGILEFVVHGLDLRRKRLEQQIAQVRALLVSRSPGLRATRAKPDSEQPLHSKPALSAAARKRIATA
jgi:hypothetical protein